MGKKFGYARVSTNKQDLEAQIEALKKEGVHTSDIYSEEISSRVKKRPEFKRLLSNIESGDMLVVYKLDRIARSLRELIDIVEELNRSGCDIKTLSGDHIIDTSTSMGKLFFNINASFAEYERDIISERTKLGLENAKAKGKTLGRTPKLDHNGIEKLKKLRNSELTVRQICEMLSISKSGYYRYVNEIDNEEIERKEVR
jgi:DNA invertase Pin-like site-specific DNA recombinase